MDRPRRTFVRDLAGETWFTALWWLSGFVLAIVLSILAVRMSDIVTTMEFLIATAATLLMLVAVVYRFFMHRTDLGDGSPSVKITTDKRTIRR